MTKAGGGGGGMGVRNKWKRREGGSGGRGAKLRVPPPRPPSARNAFSPELQMFPLAGKTRNILFVYLFISRYYFREFTPIHGRLGPVFRTNLFRAFVCRQPIRAHVIRGQATANPL